MKLEAPDEAYRLVIEAPDDIDGCIVNAEYRDEFVAWCLERALTVPALHIEVHAIGDDRGPFTVMLKFLSDDDAILFKLNWE